MRIDIVSLFPEFFDAFFNHSIIKRAIEAKRLSVGVTNPRDFSHNKHGQVDDTPYGGGAGMLMMAPPIFEAVESVIAQYDSDINDTYTTDEMCDEMSLIGNPNESIRRRIIFMGPTGQPFTQEKARELASYDQVVLICGHYEGVDYRVEKHLVDETISMIRQELKNRVVELENENKILESQRLQQRVKYDIEMIKEMGYCSGIENYSRIIERRPIGSAPATLLDYFQGDFLTVVDESHVTLPQLKGMFHGDRARKNTLVDYGFRLPCAKDNRPLTDKEFFEKVHQKIYISATPSEFELKTSQQLVEQIIRPTGLVDPKISIRPIDTQIKDLISEIKKRVEKNERVLITTLTKKMAEELCDYFLQQDIKVRYLHSDIKSIERVEILRDLRLGEFDVLIGVNLLREGLDIPEVSLVAIMDADKEGFLRSDTSLIQTIGRAARNACGEVIMYADKITGSMQRAIDETNRRREVQLAYNKKYGIIPKTIKKPIENNLLSLVASYRDLEDIIAEEMVDLNIDKKDLPKLINKLEKDMHKSAKLLDFERAAEIRDQLKKLREML